MNTPAPLFDTLDSLSLAALPETLLPSFESDYRYAVQFLYSYRGSEATFNTYRREIERLLQWLQHICKKNLPQVSREDIEAYVQFCQNPPKSWIALKKAPRFIACEGLRKPNPDWRPFVVTVSKVQHAQAQKLSADNYLLSQKSIQEIFTVCSSFFAFLIQENILSHNPVQQIRQKSKYFRTYQQARVIRKLSELQWGYVIETATHMAEREPAHERTLFIMNALYGMYLRISELAASKRWVPQMGHFQQDNDGLWWFLTVGKGNKQRQIAVSESMLASLIRWRKARQLSALPLRGETTPLIPKLQGKGPLSSTRPISRIVQACFDEAIARLIQDGFHDEALQLQAATVHWLRHTGISEDVKIRPREHVRDDAGHSSSLITDRYIDVELRERHQSAAKKKIIPDSFRD
ncbi:MAG: wecD [Gammaproteobacteria bacterium]|jgi:site-specific recombinase XerD|nr:wecD [Gammaproteobacteria bacterium]